MDPTILIVDDTLDTVQLLAVWLQGEGYQTLAASNGNDALRIAADRRPELILLDVNMPGLDGIQTCRQLHANPDTRQIPVILVSAQTPTEARAEGLLAGAVDYVTKPVNLRDLSDRISAVLQAPEQYRADTTRLLDEVVHSALVLLECDFAWLFQLDLDDRVLISRAMASSRGDDALGRFASALQLEGTALRLPYIAGENPLADAIEARHAVLDVSVQKLRTLSGSEQLCNGFESLGLHSVSLIPLTVGSRSVGILILGTVGESRFDSPRGWQLVTSLGSQASIALDYAILGQNLVEQEEIMEAEHAFLTMILDAMGDSLIVVGEGGEIEYVNHRLLTMAEYKLVDIAGQRVDMLFHPDDRQALLRGLLRGPGSTMKFDQRLYTRSGRVIPVLLSRTSFAQIDPGAYQQVLVLSDLTMQKSREEALERQSQQLRALNQAAEAISSSLSPQEVIQQILAAALDMVNAEGASVLLRNTDDPDMLTFVATVGPHADVIQGMRVPVGQGVAGWVAREAAGQLVEDTATDERFYQDIDQTSGMTTRSLIAVPLVVSDRVIGVLEVINKLSGTFDRVDMDLLESIAGTAAVSIENARLFEQTRRRLNDLGTLLDASAAVSSTLDFGSVLELIARRLLDALAVDRCLIATWDRAANVVESLVEVADAYWGPRTGPLSGLQQFPLRYAALNSGLHVIASVSDPSCDAAERQDMVAGGQHSLLTVPLWIDGQVVGLLLVYSSLSGYRFDEMGAEQVDLVAQQWAEAMGKQGRAYWSRREALTRLCESLQSVPGVMWVAVEQWLPDRNQTCRLREYGFALWTEQDGIQQPLADHPTMQRVLSIAQPKVISREGLAQDPHELSYLERTGSHMGLMVPFIIRGQPEGLIKLVVSDAARVFDAEQISLGQGIANVVGNALENAHLYQSLQHRAEALEAAYAELKEADQLKDDLLQNLSHEIQTPLLHVLGYLELMINEDFGPLTPEQREKLEFVISRAQNLSDLAKNIISVQAVQSQVMELAPVDLMDVLRHVTADWAKEAQKRAITIKVHVPDSVPPIMGDPTQLGEALAQLLDNAIKFSPSKSRVDVMVQEREAVLEIQVRDQGIGIAPQYHSHIFKRFYQVDSSATRKFGGTGLGLSIVQDIVARHGGRIWVESDSGQGSVFAFAIPKASIAADGYAYSG